MATSSEVFSKAEILTLVETLFIFLLRQYRDRAQFEKASEGFRNKKFKNQKGSKLFKPIVSPLQIGNCHV